MNWPVLFDLATSAPALYESACRQSPNLARACDAFREDPPLPSSAEMGREGRIYRPPRHYRSYCYELADDAPTDDLSSDVLVVKGAEIALDDYPKLIEWLKSRPCRNYIKNRSMIDNLAIRERKVPGAMTLHEAEVEKNIGLAVHRAHLEHYGTLAHIPVPVLTLGVPDEKVERAKSILKSTLVQAGWERIEPHIDHGLAIFIYYYPSAPLRLDQVLEYGALREQVPEWADIGGLGTAKKMPSFLSSALQNFDAEAAFEGWMQLFVRLLYLDFLPFTSNAIMHGSMLASSNLCIDGGGCDIDSIVSMKDYPDDHFIMESFISSVGQLHRTVATAFGLPADQGELDNLIYGFLLAQFRRIIEQERRETVQLHPLIERVLSLQSFMDAAELVPYLSRIPGAKLAHVTSLSDSNNRYFEPQHDESGATLQEEN